MGWIYRQVLGDPRPLFDANIFHPEPLTLAYSDAMLLPSLTAAPLLAANLHPVLVYNLMLLSGFLFSGLVTYLLVQRLTGSTCAYPMLMRAAGARPGAVDERLPRSRQITRLTWSGLWVSFGIRLRRLVLRTARARDAGAERARPAVILLAAYLPCFSARRTPNPSFCSQPWAAGTTSGSGSTLVPRPGASSSG